MDRAVRCLNAGLLIQFWHRFISQSRILIFPSFRKRRARSSSLRRPARLVAFVHTVQAGSFAQAGRLIGATPSAVSKSLGWLDHRLGMRLHLRSTPSLSLTTEAAYYERVAALLAASSRNLRCHRARTETFNDQISLQASSGSEPEAHARDEACVADVASVGARKISGVGKAALPMDPDIGCELARELIAQPDAKLDAGQARTNAIAWDVLCGQIDLGARLNNQPLRNAHIVVAACAHKYVTPIGEENRAFQLKPVRRETFDADRRIGARWFEIIA